MRARGAESAVRAPAMINKSGGTTLMRNPDKGRGSKASVGGKKGMSGRQNKSRCPAPRAGAAGSLSGGFSGG